MAPVELRLRNTDLRYGTVCPKCAGPKTLQAAECRGCFNERQKAPDHYELRTCACGETKAVRSAKCRRCASDRLRGVPVRGREQRADHPWRHDLISRFERRTQHIAKSDMATCDVVQGSQRLSLEAEPA